MFEGCRVDETRAAAKVTSLHPAVDQPLPVSGSHSPQAAPALVLIANPSADVYGSDLQMLESVTALRNAGYRVTVALPADGPLVERLRTRGADIEFTDYQVLRRANQNPLAFLRMVLLMLASIPRLVRLIRRHRPSLVYVNTVTLPWWLVAARLSRVPVACHVHEAEDADSQLVLWGLYGQLLLAHTVIVNSRTTLDAVSATVSRIRHRSQLIYNGVPQPNGQTTPPNRQRPFQIVSVGRLSPRKGQHLLLDAVAVLRRRGHDVELELAGSAFPGYEWYVEQLQARAAGPDLRGTVRFAGYCAPVWPNLQRSGVVVQTCSTESLGNAVIEAQLAGRPVVAAAARGHLETIEDGVTGLLFPVGDVAAIADAVARIIEDNGLATALAAQARSRAQETFSLDRYAKEIVAVVDSVARRTASVVGG